MSDLTKRLEPIALHADTANRSEREISFAQLECAVLRRRRILLALPFVIAFITLIVTLVLPRSYTTTVSFVPQAQNAQSAVAGLAQQFGVSIGGDDPTQTPGFYADLVSTPELLRSLALTRYTVGSGRDTLGGTFIELDDLIDDDQGVMLDNAITEIQKSVMRVESDPTTSIVRISFRTKWPRLSEQMAQRLLALVDSFNVSIHQRKAEAERAFMEARLTATRAELTMAEDRLQSFLERNKDFRNDPQLTTQHDRLQREVTMRQEVYSGINQIYEQARIEAVRNTPAIGVIEPARQPLRADRRHIAVKLVMAFMLSFLLALGVVVLAELLSAGESFQEAIREERIALRREALSDLRRLRSFGRRVTTRSVAA